MNSFLFQYFLQLTLTFLLLILQEEGGAVITPMRREALGGAAETVAAVANLQVVSANALQPVAHTETVIATVTSPPTSPRLPSILEAAIKAEPKVEVERLPSPHSVHEERMSQARLIFFNYVKFCPHF